MKKGAIARLLNSKVHGGIYQEVQLPSSVRELWTGPTSLLSCSAHIFLFLNLCQTPAQILGCLSLYCWAFWKLSPKPLVLNSFLLSKSLLRVWLSLRVCFQPESVHHTGSANLKHTTAPQLTEEIWSLASWLSISLWGAGCVSAGGWDRNDMRGNRGVASLLEDAWLFCNERLEEKILQKQADSEGKGKSKSRLASGKKSNWVAPREDGRRCQRDLESWVASVVFCQI